MARHRRSLAVPRLPRPSRRRERRARRSPPARRERSGRRVAAMTGVQSLDAPRITRTASSRTSALVSASARRANAVRSSSGSLAAPASASRRTCGSGSRLATRVVTLSTAPAAARPINATRRAATSFPVRAVLRINATAREPRSPVERRERASAYSPCITFASGNPARSSTARSAARAAPLSAYGRRPSARANAPATARSLSRFRRAMSARCARSTAARAESGVAGPRGIPCTLWARAFAASARSAGDPSSSAATSGANKSARCSRPMARSATDRILGSLLRAPSSSGAVPPAARASSAARIRSSRVESAAGTAPRRTTRRVAGTIIVLECDRAAALASAGRRAAHARRRRVGDRHQRLNVRP